MLQRSLEAGGGGMVKVKVDTHYVDRMQLVSEGKREPPQGVGLLVFMGLVISYAKE